MVEIAAVKKPWQLVLPQSIYSEIHSHLFSGDGDEHGAVLLAGMSTAGHNVRLLARELYLAKDGVDYVPGKRGYRMLKADFIATRIEQCRQQGLAYLAIHNHGGRDSVGFSADDFRSHERGYPALLDISQGQPVGALVFAENAIAGEIWLPVGKRVELAGASIVGASRRQLMPAPLAGRRGVNPMYDRQARLFGDAGQAILADAKVGIVGLGGVGSLIAEYLGRLGVGKFVLVDPERAEITNMPRLTGAYRRDALSWFTSQYMPTWIRNSAMRLAKPN
jgi:hypothetical protein